MDRLVFATGPAGRRIAEERRLLGEFLAGPLGVEVEVAALDSYEALLASLASGQAQVAWLPPALLVEARDRHGAIPLLVSRRGGEGAYGSVLFVRSDAPWRNAGDIRGTRVAWVDPVSCSGYLFPRLALIRRGIDPDGYFGAERMLGSHGAVVQAVDEGEADVGATWAHHAHTHPVEAPVQTGWAKRFGAEHMRVVLTTPPIPGDAIAAHPSLEPRQRTRVAHALRHLPGTARGRRVLESLFGASRLGPFRQEGYHVVQQALRAARHRTNPPPA